MEFVLVDYVYPARASPLGLRRTRASRANSGIQLQRMSTLGHIVGQGISWHGHGKIFRTTLC